MTEFSWQNKLEDKGLRSKEIEYNA